MATTVGIRELKSHLSYWVRQVKSGASVVITERGEPVGRFVPVGTSLETRTRQLVEANVIAWSGRKLPDTAPRVARGKARKTVADLLLEDRE